MHIERNHASEKSKNKPCKESKVVLVNKEYWSSGEETDTEEKDTEETMEDIQGITDMENAVIIPPKTSNKVGGIVDEANMDTIVSNDVPKIKISEVATNSGEMEEDSEFQLQLSEDENGRI